MIWLFSSLLALALLAGCATPAPVKQALVSMDENYEANLTLMRQYRELVIMMNTRHEYWYRYLSTRAKLDLALMLATTDPRGADNARVVDEWGKILGGDLVALINTIRLTGLPERRGTPGSTQVVFATGGTTVDRLLQTIPVLTAKVIASVDGDYKTLVGADLSAFEAYETNVGSLRKSNAVVKRYLDIDVTVAPKDVKEISDAIRALR